MKDGIENSLERLRRKRGLSVARLAQAAGASRQTVYAIDAGAYVPNTAVALRLARTLEVRVEELFTLTGDTPAPHLRTANAVLLSGSGPLDPGQPVQLCRVGKKLIAAAPAPFPWSLPASDGVVSCPAADGAHAKVRLYEQEADFGGRVLVAGCDPAIPVLARHVQRAGVELIVAHRNSSQGLSVLEEGWVHVAGTHLGDDNLSEIRRKFPNNSVAAISFAVWEEGILTARGNPKHIRGVEDFGRPDVIIMNREKGAGSRRLLDLHLRKLGIDARQVRGYETAVPGHLFAAWQVRTGAADCCVATRAAAHVFGLEFISLASERYDLVIRRNQLGLPGVEALLKVITRSSFRRELESVGG